MVYGLFEGCLPQILLGPFLNTLTYLKPTMEEVCLLPFLTNYKAAIYIALYHQNVLNIAWYKQNSMD